MNSATLVAVLAFIVVGIFAIAAWSVARRERTASLRKRFGEEYEHALQHHPDRSSAEAELRQRENRMQGVPVHSLRPEVKEQFANRWHEIQARFVDDPKGANREAEELIREALHAGGYPPGPFEMQAENLSVEHPGCAGHYREAHEIATREGPPAPTVEGLQRAFFGYRTVLEELLEVHHVS